MHSHSSLKNSSFTLMEVFFVVACNPLFTLYLWDWSIPATQEQGVEDNDYILLQPGLQPLLLNGLQASLVLCLSRNPELHAVLQPQLHDSEMEGNNYSPRSVGCLLAKATQDILPTKILCKCFKICLTLQAPWAFWPFGLLSLRVCLIFWNDLALGISYIWEKLNLHEWR